MSEPILPPGLNKQHSTFVLAIAQGEKIPDAERIAGYGVGTGRYLLSRPDIRAALERAIRAELQDAAPIALRTLRKLVESGSERIQVDAAKILLDRAGYVPPAKAADSGAAEKQLSEMSQDELHNAMSKSAADVERLERELASRATQVNAPISADTAPNPNSFLE